MAEPLSKAELQAIDDLVADADLSSGSLTGFRNAAQLKDYLVAIAIEAKAGGDAATKALTAIANEIQLSADSTQTGLTAAQKNAAELDKFVEEGIVSPEERVQIIREGFGLDKAGGAISPPSFRSTEAGVRLEAELRNPPTFSTSKEGLELKGGIDREASDRDFAAALERVQEQQRGQNRRSALEQATSIFGESLGSMLPSGADFGGFQPGGPLQAISNIGGFGGGFEERAQPVQTQVKPQDFLNFLGTGQPNLTPSRVNLSREEVLRALVSGQHRTSGAGGGI